MIRRPVGFTGSRFPSFWGRALPEDSGDRPAEVASSEERGEAGVAASSSVVAGSEVSSVGSNGVMAGLLSRDVVKSFGGLAALAAVLMEVVVLGAEGRVLGSGSMLVDESCHDG